jgi:uncharacterized membrane protein YczE
MILAVSIIGVTTEISLFPHLGMVRSDSMMIAQVNKKVPRDIL